MNVPVLEAFSWLPAYSAPALYRSPPVALNVNVFSAENPPVAVFVMEGALKLMLPPECTAPTLEKALANVIVAVPVPELAATMREVVPPKLSVLAASVIFPEVVTMPLLFTESVPAFTFMLLPNRMPPLLTVTLTPLVPPCPLMSSKPPDWMRPAPVTI